MAQMRIVNWPKFSGEKCAKCGAMLNVGAAYCAGCGTPVPGGPADVQEAQAAPAGESSTAAHGMPARDPVAGRSLTTVVALATALVTFLLVMFLRSCA